MTAENPSPTVHPVASHRVASALAVLLIVAVLTGLFLGLGDPLSIRLAANSLIIAAGTAVVVLPVSAFAGLVLFRTNVIGRPLLQTLLTVWLFVPVYVHIAGWRDLCGPQGWFPLEVASGNLIDGWTGTIFLHALAAFPWATLLLGIAFRRTPLPLEEDALLQVSTLNVLRRITLRQGLDGLLVAGVWTLISVFGEMSIASVCNVRTYSEVVFTGIPLGHPADAAVLTILPGAVLTIAVVLLAAWLARQLSPDNDLPESNPTRLLPLRGARIGISLAAWSVFVLGLGPAVIGLLIKVGATVQQVDGHFVRGWSLAKAVGLTLSSVAAYHTELTWTLLLALSAAALTMLLGLVLSQTALRSSAGRWLAAMLFAVLFAIPKPVVGVLLGWFLSRPQLAVLAPLVDRSIFAPLWAVLTVTLPVVTFFYWHVLAPQRQLLELAAVDGSSPGHAFWRVVVPLRWAAILAGGLVAFVLAAGDIAASILVLPPGIDTLSRRIFGLLHFGGEDNVAGILLMNLLTVAVVAWIVQALVVRQRAMAGQVEISPENAAAYYTANNRSRRTPLA